MPRRKTVFVDGNFYHIYNRVIDGAKLFYCSEDYLHFIEVYKRYAAKYHILTIAYCLMPNHYHFLIRVNARSDVSKCFSDFLNGYVQWLNRRRGRRGRLFENRFNSKHVSEDAYLIHLCRYIHRNPVKSRLISDLNFWPFSNYLEFAGRRNGSLFEPQIFADLFSDFEEYRRFVENYDDRHDDKLERYLFQK